jgi:hypothetical protein
MSHSLAKADRVEQRRGYFGHQLAFAQIGIKAETALTANGDDQLPGTGL